MTGDNILTAISVAHDCKLIRPGTTIIKVDADLIQDSYSSRLNVSYTIQENEKDGEVFTYFSYNSFNSSISVVNWEYNVYFMHMSLLMRDLIGQNKSKY